MKYTQTEHGTNLYLLEEAALALAIGCGRCGGRSHVTFRWRRVGGVWLAFSRR